MVEKFSKKQVAMVRFGLILISLVIFTSCTTHHIYFDIEKQRLISCNGDPLLKLSINGNSGNGIDDGCTIRWKGNNNESPFSIDINNLPKGYIELTGGIKRLKPFKLYPNSQYTIDKSGMGLSPHYIRIWTNAKGIVYKTTNPNCDCGDGDDGIPTDWVVPSNQSQ
jgi:hypothetical protein